MLATPSTPNCDHPKCPQILPNVPWAEKSLPVENHWISPVQTLTLQGNGTDSVRQPGFSPRGLPLDKRTRKEGTESKAKEKKPGSKHTDSLILTLLPTSTIGPRSRSPSYKQEEKQLERQHPPSQALGRAGPPPDPGRWPLRVSRGHAALPRDCCRGGQLTSSPEASSGAVKGQADGAGSTCDKQPDGSEHRNATQRCGCSHSRDFPTRTGVGIKVECRCRGLLP